MNEDVIREIVSKTVKKFLESSANEIKNEAEKKQESKLENSGNTMPVGISARHVHLTREAVETLFGKGHKLTFKRDITQPGDFLAVERVSVITSKGELRNVAILGPERKQVQVEISQTDARLLGVDPPLRLSGDVENGATVHIVSDNAVITASNSTIIAKNHIHMTPKDAENFKVKNGDRVCVRVNTKRPVLFDDVIVRVNDKFKLSFHVDFDEANACMLQDNDCAVIVKELCDCNQTLTSRDERGASVKVEKFFSKDAGSSFKTSASSEKFISEQKAKELAKGNVKTLSFKKGVILSPLAKDVFSTARIEVEFV
ncbi:MAG: phosphate propanoyltransferase [Spirochaetaceae bacterium]|nr:phosphate propanoyltransferase [Spirochaetaceae bacterium]